MLRFTHISSRSRNNMIRLASKTAMNFVYAKNMNKLSFLCKFLGFLKNVCSELCHLLCFSDFYELKVRYITVIQVSNLLNRLCNFFQKLCIIVGSWK